MKLGYLVLSVVLVLAACSISQAATKVLEWKFEDNLNDTSGSGINGTAYGTPVYTAGVSGQAFSADGTNSSYKTGIDPNILPVLATDTWSTNIWVYPTVEPGNWRILWCLGAKPDAWDGFPGGTSRAIYNSTGDGKIVFTEGPKDDSGATTTGGKYVSTGIPFDVGQWQMITTTYDGTQVKVYKNGMLVGARDIPMLNAPGEVRVPTYPWTGLYFFIGKIDEFTVWRGTLTQQEILDLIIPGTLPEYVPVEEKIYYTMDDLDSTTTISDHSGNSNTGTLYGYTSPIENWLFPSPKGAALLFDGGQAIFPPTGVDISRNAQYSVAFWYKSSYQPYYTAFYSEKSPTSGNGSSFIIRGDAGFDGTIKVYGKDRDYNVQYMLTYDASPYMHSNAWHHLAVTADGNEARLYIDGEAMATAHISYTGGKTTMNAAVGYYWDEDGFLGDWDRTYMDDFHLFRGVLTQEDIQALMALGNLDNDLDVDLIDLGDIGSQWLEPSVIDVNMTVDDMEGSLSGWSVVVDGNFTGTGTISSATNAYEGSKSLRWDYDLPALTGGNYSGIRYDLGTNKDLSTYNLMRLYLYRHAGNTTEDRLMVIFLDSSMQSKAEAWIEDANCVVKPVNQWSEWLINLDAQLEGPAGVGYVTKSQLTAIRYIVIACGGSKEEARTGTIDIDEIKLFELPLCSPYLTGDLNFDCKVNFRDFTILAEDWMLGID
ncbi:MAG: LamG domain-containing protein [Phycisphaerae bacterium]|jgi:hypothetical protein